VQLVTRLGRDPETGLARGYADNVGVQYGLDALKAGQITAEQFIDLNEKVGGYDVAGTAGLATTPVIDLRAYTDAVDDIHTRFWSFAIRQRLVDAFGPDGARGQAIW
jgi:hypothetical protein